MTTRHTLQTEWCLDGSNDVALGIVYDFSPGLREQGPAYSHGGLPAEPAECYVVTVMVNGDPATETEFDQVVTSDALYEKMVENVGE